VCAGARAEAGRRYVKLFFKIVGWIVGAIFLFVVWTNSDDTTKWVIDGALIIWLVVLPAWQEYTRRRYAHMERVEQELRATRLAVEQQLRQSESRARWGAADRPEL
jgi:hypothetical protein